LHLTCAPDFVLQNQKLGSLLPSPPNSHSTVRSAERRSRAHCRSRSPPSVLAKVSSWTLWALRSTRERTPPAERSPAGGMSARKRSFAEARLRQQRRGIPWDSSMHGKRGNSPLMTSSFNGLSLVAFGDWTGPTTVDKVTQPGGWSGWRKELKAPVGAKVGTGSRQTIHHGVFGIRVFRKSCGVWTPAWCIVGVFRNPPAIHQAGPRAKRAGQLGVY